MQLRGDFVYFTFDGLLKSDNDPVESLTLITWIASPSEYRSITVLSADDLGIRFRF